MSRSEFMRNKGLEHLSDKDKSAVRSFAYRLRCLIDSKGYKVGSLTSKELARFLLYGKSVKKCVETKRDWQECVKTCKKGLTLTQGLEKEAKDFTKDFIKEIKNGKGFSKFK